MSNARPLTGAEKKHTRELLRGKPRKVKKSECRNKSNTIRRPNKTGGLFLSMDACSHNGHYRIVELREMLNSENNDLKSASIRAIKEKNPSLNVLIHDLACKSTYSKGVADHVLLDAFDVRCHRTLGEKKIEILPGNTILQTIQFASKCLG